MKPVLKWCCHERSTHSSQKNGTRRRKWKLLKKIGTEGKKGGWSCAPRLFIQGEQFHVQGPVFNATTVLKKQSRFSDLKGIWIRHIATVREKHTVFWRWGRGGRRNSKLKIAKVPVKNGCKGYSKVKWSKYMDLSNSDLSQLVMKYQVEF